MNAAARRRDQTGDDSSDLEHRVSDRERRHERTRALLLDALSAAAILLIGFIFRPEGRHAVMLGFCCGLFVPKIIISLFLRDRPPAGIPPQRRPAPVAPWRGLDRGAIGNRKAAG
jgi:hypothetical protein